MADNLSVSWDEYQRNICKGLGALQQRGEFVDMTLAADGHHVKVHQMVLSLVSPFIKDLINSANCPHPVIFLNRVSYQTMQAILEYAYTGEVVIKKDKIGEFLEASKDLHIKGLENMLKNARSSINTQSSDIEPKQVENGNKSHERKRRKMCHEEALLRTGPCVQDDNDFHTDVKEVQVESTSLDYCDEEESTNVTAESLHETEKALQEKLTPLQYSVSCQGNLQLVLNRYLYAMRHTRKNDERFWRCISQQRTACPAIVTTAGERIRERSFPHNHAFHDKQILKRVKNCNIFTTLNEVEDAAAAKKRSKEDIDLLKQALNKIN